jgi:hypothetical protein
MVAMQHSGPTPPFEGDTALLPPRARRIVFVVVGALLALTTYMLAVRGPAIVFDLARGAMSYCF